MKLSIVIPAYNEEKRIPRMLDAYLDYFPPRYDQQVELIVVVNGSRDSTAEICRAYSVKHAQVSVIEEREAIGKGGAIIVGFKHAGGDLIGFADADGSTPPEAFDDLARNVGDAGAIIASRWFPESVVEPRQPLKRRIASRIFNFCVRVTFGMDINDTQCGAKVLRRDAVNAILPHLGITRWAFDVDLLFQVHRAGFAILEWPTVWRDEGGSQLKIVRASVEMFIAIVRLRLIYSPLRWVVTLYDRTLGTILFSRPS
jgi:glycosyltransferase involved in cell wall biosynthesis